MGNTVQCLSEFDLFLIILFSNNMWTNVMVTWKYPSGKQMPDIICPA